MSDGNIIITSAIVINILAIFLSFFLPPKKALYGNVLCISAANILWFVIAILYFLSQKHWQISFYVSEFLGTWTFTFTPISAFFSSIVAVIMTINMWYSLGYLRPWTHGFTPFVSYTNISGKNASTAPIRSHITFLALLNLVFYGILTAQNIFSFLILWEVMSLLIFFLSTLENEKHDIQYSGIYYIIAMQISAICIITGLILLEFTPQKNIGALIAIAGFSIKAGFFPFHTWLPRSDVSAPNHISAIMSGLTSKMAIYGIIMVILKQPILQNWVLGIFLLFSVLSIIYGAMQASIQKDFKKVLAYSTIENIGIIGLGISISLLGIQYNIDLLAYLGFSATLMHVAAHALSKTLGFSTLGTIELSVGTRNTEELGGLFQYFPRTTAMFFVSSAALSALPLSLNFISEMTIIYAIMSLNKEIMLNTTSESSAQFLIFSLYGSVICLIFASGLIFMSMAKVFSVAFLGNSRVHYPKENSKYISRYLEIPLYVITFLIISLGIFPQIIYHTTSNISKNLIENLTKNELSYLLKEEVIEYNQALNKITSILSIAIIFLVIFIIRYFTVKKKNKISYNNTWACGYKNITARMQYTGFSFSEPLFQILKPLIALKKDEKSIKNKIFPEKSHIFIAIFDSIDYIFVRKIIKLSEYILQKFSWIQIGSIQIYLLYGITFLIISLIFALQG